jgi:hypothetical protein
MIDQTKKNDLIRVKIDITGEERLVLKGHIRWIGPVGWNGKCRVGLQFTPSGKTKYFNSPFALAKLQVLQEKYQQDYRDRAVKKEDAG